MTDYTVKPGEVRPITWPLGDPGIAAQLTYKVKNEADDSVFYPASNTGIGERETGDYSIHAFTFPTIEGLYQGLLYQGATLIWADSIAVSYSLAAAGNPPSNAERYVTIAELKATLSLTGQSYADAEALLGLDAASRGLERVYNQNLPWTTPTSGTRYYTRSADRYITLGDVVDVTAIDLDYAIWEDLYYDSPDYYSTDIGPGTYSTPLASDQYRLLPIDAGLPGNGEPYRRLELKRGSQIYRLPIGTDAIRVTGSFGWTQIPSGVKIATSMLAQRLLRRTREAPFGILAVGAEGAAIRARDIANDPDIRFAMEGVQGPGKKLFV